MKRNSTISLFVAQEICEKCTLHNLQHSRDLRERDENGCYLHIFYRISYSTWTANSKPSYHNIVANMQTNDGTRFMGTEFQEKMITIIIKCSTSFQYSIFCAQNAVSSTSAPSYWNLNETFSHLHGRWPQMIGFIVSFVQLFIVYSWCVYCRWPLCIIKDLITLWALEPLPQQVPDAMLHIFIRDLRWDASNFPDFGLKFTARNDWFILSGIGIYILLLNISW